VDFFIEELLPDGSRFLSCVSHPLKHFSSFNAYYFFIIFFNLHKLYNFPFSLLRQPPTTISGVFLCRNVHLLFKGHGISSSLAIGSLSVPSVSSCLWTRDLALFYLYLCGKSPEAAIRTLSCPYLLTLKHVRFRFLVPVLSKWQSLTRSQVKSGPIISLINESDVSLPHPFFLADSLRSRLVSASIIRNNGPDPPPRFGVPL